MNKHMVPILNRPMILYPLETLKYAGVTDIMIVTGGNHIGAIAEFLGDGSEYGVSITYRVQKDAGGIAQALGLAKDFVGNDAVAVILGDNIFDKTKLPKTLPFAVGFSKALFFFSPVKDPTRFGVPGFKDGKLIGIEEKPAQPKSQYAQTGLYIYPPNVFTIIPTLRPSARGELELTDVNNWYVHNNACEYHIFEGFWSDAGTRNSLKEVIDWVHSQES
jgi:glucose-1-phosphate thymidylyltransferase